MVLPLADETRFGFTALVRGPASARATATAAEQLGYDSLWVGDHVAFTTPIFDPLLSLGLLACCSERLLLGTSVYLLALRHPVPVAKQVATLDQFCDGRLIFGVGVGGEFPGEFAACGVPVRERGARLAEAVPLLRALWSGKAVAAPGPHFPIPETQLLPTPAQTGGPPLWFGGRSPAALRRMGRLADGWMSYVVTADRYRQGLEQIAAAATEAGRRIEHFATSHFFFLRMEESYDAAHATANRDLSRRYAMDFSTPTRKYAALGRAEQVAEYLELYRAAGVRHFIVDPVGPPREREEQLARFAGEVIPLLRK